MTQEVLKLALEALECALSDHRPYIVQCKEAITAIKEALSQPEQEPVDCERCNRLEDALKRANGLAEHFERAWYLRGDEIERLTAQPEQEPVAWMSEHRFDELRKGFTVMTTLTKQRVFEDDVAIYTTPPQRKPLTDEEIKEIAKNYALNNPTTPLHFARAIEAAHGITGEKK